MSSDETKFSCRGLEVSILPIPTRVTEEGEIRFTSGLFLVDDMRAMVVIETGKEEATALFSESRGFFKFFSSYLDLVSSIKGTPDQ